MNKIRLGVLGVGRWGPNLLRCFHTHANVEVVAVVDKQPNRLKLIQERYPEIQVSSSENDILKNPEIDAVVISTPTETHYRLTKTALENGKHVFVEKPLAKSSREGQLLVKLAARKKRTLFVGHIFVYNAGIQAAKRTIESGELGKIYYVRATRTNLGPVRSDVNAFWDLAPHDLSILNYWFGTSPKSVSASGGVFLNKGVEDVVFASYTYPGNILANLHVSWLNPKKVREIVVVGAKKMLIWDDMDLNLPIRIYDKDVQPVQKTPEDHLVVDSFASFRASIFKADKVIPKIQLNEPLAAECAAFIEAIENPKSSLSDGKKGTQVVCALEATDRSLRQKGKTIPIRYT
jgi:predicted dehydrogenase